MRTLTATLVRSFAVAACALTVLGGCAKKATDTTSNLTLSGSLSGSSSIISHLALDPQFMRGIIHRAVSFSGKTIVCTTLEVPPSTVTGTVASDNTFSLALAKDIPYRCAILNGSTVVATFVFTDSNSKSMNGGSQSIDTVALSGSASISLSVNTDAGTATGDAGEITISDTGSNSFDFTGSYVISALGATLPEGYSALCSGGGGGGGGCHGPSAGETIYMKRFIGKNFTPDTQCSTDLTTANNAHLPFTAACNGTTGTEDIYGVTIWSNETSYNNCGNKLGFSYAEGKARAHVDLTGSGVNQGAPDWALTASVSGGGTANMTDGWMADTATSDWDIQNCVPTEVAGHKAYKCSEINGTDYQINIGGGCVDSSGDPVQPDWQNVTWGSCTNTTLTGDLAGFQRNVCTATQGSNSYQCTNTWAVYDSSDQITNFMNFDWNDTKLVNRGAACSTISNATNPLQRAQCFANYYQRTFNDGGSNACLPKVRFNWNTTDATKFLMKEGPLKANNQHVMAGGRYMAGDAFTFRDEENDYRGVQVTDSNGGNSWVNCRVKNVFTISLKKLNSTDYMAVFVSEGSLLDTENNACAAAAEEKLGLGKFRTMFKLTPAP